MSCLRSRNMLSRIIETPFPRTETLLITPKGVVVLATLFWRKDARWLLAAKVARIMNAEALMAVGAFLCRADNRFCLVETLA